MPNATQVVGHTAGGTRMRTDGDGQQGTEMPVVPFIRASSLYRERFYDQTRLSSTADQDLGSIDVPAYGYLRHVVIQVTATGGTGTTLVATEDAPFNAIKNITLSEPNGAVIAQFNNGYQMYLANKYGGYNFGSDPKLGLFSVTTATAFTYSFQLRIPVEINQRDGLGSLPNQNSAANFKVRATLSSSADTILSGTITAQPNVRIQMWTETWDQPEAQVAGQLQATTPPAMNTTQYWSVQTYNISSGQFNQRLTRVGNYIRNLIFLWEASNGDRVAADATFPDPATLYLDTRPFDYVGRTNWLNQIYERYGYLVSTNVAAPAATANVGGARDSSVWPYDFCHEFDCQVGHENRDLWLPTLGSSRLEIQGVFGQAGVLTVLTNDVTIAGPVFL